MKELVLQLEGSIPVKLLFCRSSEVSMLSPGPQSGGREPDREQLWQLRLVRLLKAPNVPHCEGSVPAKTPFSGDELGQQHACNEGALTWNTGTTACLQRGRYPMKH